MTISDQNIFSLLWVWLLFIHLRIKKEHMKLLKNQRDDPSWPVGMGEE